MVAPNTDALLDALKSLTQQKVDANRTNARRSTGPKTPAGKARSARNATTHGLTGSSPTLLAGEDPAEFAAFRQELLDDLRPRGALQRQLAQQVVWLTWKLNVRLPRCEAAAAAELIRRPCEAWDQEVEKRRHPVFDSAFSMNAERYAQRYPRPPERTGAEAAGVELVDACQGVNHWGKEAKRKGDEPLAKLEQIACRLRGNLMSLLRLYRKMQEEDGKAEAAEEAENAPVQNEPTAAGKDAATDGGGASGAPSQDQKATSGGEIRVVAGPPSSPAPNPAWRETGGLQNEPTPPLNAPAAATPAGAVQGSVAG